MWNLQRICEQLNAPYLIASPCQILCVLNEARRRGERLLWAVPHSRGSSRVGSGSLLISNIDQATKVNMLSLAS